MRYFTRNLCDGELSDQMFERAFDEYKAYIQQHAPRMLGSVRRLATATDLHDAKIIRASVDSSTRTAWILLRSGDLQHGYFNVDIRYLNVSRFSAEPDFERIVENPDSELLYDEVEALGNEYEHSMIFDPAGEVSVHFGDVQVTTTPAKSRDIDVTGERLMMR